MQVAGTCRLTMLMCGKVTHKKLKDNQLTIPCLFIAKVLNLQFDLDKLVYYTYSVDRVEMTNIFNNIQNIVTYKLDYGIIFL